MAAGTEIKRLRESQLKKLSAETAASLIGVDVQRLRKWEQRDSDPKDSGDIIKVEKYFGVPLNKLKDLEDFQFYDSAKLELEKEIIYKKNPIYAQQSKPVNEADVIKMLQQHIKDLQTQNEWIKKMFEEMKDKTDTNLLTALDNQRVMMRQIAVQSHLEAEYFSGGDKKKFAEQLKKIDTLITAGM